MYNLDIYCTLIVPSDVLWSKLKVDKSSDFKSVHCDKYLIMIHFTISSFNTLLRYPLWNKLVCPHLCSNLRVIYTMHLSSNRRD